MIRTLQKKLAIATLLFSLVFTTGCSLLPVRLSAQPTSVELAIETVQPGGRPGTYNVAGRTNLPNDTELSVAAVRLLEPDAAQSFNQEPAYAILSRQPVKVNQGTWKTSLNLWQVGPDGSYRESWQLAAADLEAPLTPAKDVTFVATLEPINLSKSVKEQLTSQSKRFEGNLVRFTSDGETYLQTTRTVALNLPSGKTTPSAPRPGDIDSNLSDRPITTQTAKPAPNAETVKPDATDAPLRPEEFMR